MIQLSGDLGWQAQEALDDLHLGIDAGRSVVTATHNFEQKLWGVDTLSAHSFDYDSSHEDLAAFFDGLFRELLSLREELDALEKGELHFVLEQEAAEKSGAPWLVRHRKIVNDEVKEEARIAKKLLQRVHHVFLELKAKFAEGEHMFAVDLEKAQVTQMKLQERHAEEEIKYFIERLLAFFVAYENILRKELARLERA